jgi:transcriptional regulator with XRE-family HTH domain
MDEEERREFGAFLKRLRDDAGKSLREAATEIGISDSYLYQMERGERGAPKLEVMRNMASAYGVSLDSIMAKAKLTEPEEIDLYHDQLERAFEYVRKDKRFKFGTHMNSQELTPEAKRFIVEMYQKFTGTVLLDALAKERGGEGET